MRHAFGATGAQRALRALVLLLVATASATGASATRAAVPAWTSYNHDGFRTATDPDSSSPTSPTAAWSTAPQLDGSVFAQPLVVGSRVYVATESNTIYALDTATGTVLWQRNVGTPVPASSLPCGDINPTVGITGTPSIDAAAGRIYAVADTLAGGVIQHRLVALNLTDGAPVAGFPVPVDPPGADPKAILQRAALALDSGRVIVPYGGNAGDCPPYHGWLVSAAQASPGSQTQFEVEAAAGQQGGAIWGSGDGPSLDAAGHLFVATGNGIGSSSTPNLQESVVELGPGLNLIASWTPSNWKALDGTDSDLGSSEPLPLPGGLLFQAGKDGVGRLLSATSLGTSGQVFSAAVCGSGGVFGASLYRAGVIYVPCSGGLAALRLTTAPGPSFSPVPGWSAPGAASGPPIFAGGLVWSTGWRRTKILYGLDPGTGAVRFQSPLGTFNPFATPSAGGGGLFVAAGSRLAAFKISSFPPATSTTLASSSNPSRSGRGLTLIAAVSPAADAGTVSFTEAGRVLPGCIAVAVMPPTGRASCHANLPVGSHVLVASYSGDSYFGPSVSVPLTQVVIRAARPEVSAVGLRPRRVTARRGTVLAVTLSTSARLRVLLARPKAPGRVVRAETFNGRRGHNRLPLFLRGLRPGRYAATIVARHAGGPGSKPITLRFEILPG